MYSAQKELNGVNLLIFEKHSAARRAAFALAGKNVLCDKTPYKVGNHPIWYYEVKVGVETFVTVGSNGNVMTCFYRPDFDTRAAQPEELLSGPVVWVDDPEKAQTTLSLRWLMLRRIPVKRLFVEGDDDSEGHLNCRNLIQLLGDRNAKAFNCPKEPIWTRALVRQALLQPDTLNHSKAEAARARHEFDFRASRALERAFEDKRQEVGITGQAYTRYGPVILPLVRLIKLHNAESCASPLIVEVLDQVGRKWSAISNDNLLEDVSTSPTLTNVQPEGVQEQVIPPKPLPLTMASLLKEGPEDLKLTVKEVYEAVKWCQAEGLVTYANTSTNCYPVDHRREEMAGYAEVLLDGEFEPNYDDLGNNDDSMFLPIVATGKQYTARDETTPNPAVSSFFLFTLNI